MDKAIALGWKESESLKAANPAIDPKELRDKVEAMRPKFKEQARAECASK